MKHFFTLTLVLVCGSLTNFCQAQNGPNLLGVKGTFSAPFVTPNNNASWCTRSGFYSYTPIDNVGNPLDSLDNSGNSIPGSGYDYTASNKGLQPEFTYTLLKTIGDSTGGNCIKGDWRGWDHTGDGGYFMAVNGAPNDTKSPIFYQINSIVVCAGTQYEFSAWVINLLPKSSSYAIAGSEPNISFKVKTNLGEQIIATSGPIAYTEKPVWVKVSGTFIVPATVNTVDLEVVNATAIAWGNDLGLDDISFSVKQSNISLSDLNGGVPPTGLCAGSSAAINFTIDDATHTNTWYKWQISTDGGATYTDNSSPATASFTGDTYTLALNLNNVTTGMNGYRYRLIVATSEAGLDNPICSFVNEYFLIVNECGIAPVTLTQFEGTYQNGASYLAWQTSQEFNSDYFEVYRSYDGQNFSPISTVKSAGNSQQITNYAYTDYAPGNGKYVYYKLKQVDLDGEFVFTTIIKLAMGKNASLEVFPNPFHTRFTISFSATETADAQVVLRNTIGQPVFTKTIKANKGSNTLLISNLPALQPGIYYLSISNEDINYIQKLQKQ